jgi:DNA-binding transcriptional LysR family regulator
LNFHFWKSKMTPLNFDMDALRTMVVGVELGGFSHAAGRLNRSPSAVSMQLRKLETQTGQRLFKRNGRGLILTEAGDVLLQYARRVLALNDEMGLALGAIDKGGTVRVGMPQDFTDAVLPSLLTRYSKARPATHVEVKAGRNFALAEDVANGRLDMALAFCAGGKGGANRIAAVPGVWVTRTRPTGAGNAKLLGTKARATTAGATKARDTEIRHIQGFAKEGGVVPLIVFDGPCLFRDMGIDALARAGIPWRLAMTTPSLAGLWCGVRAGLGVTVRTPLAIPRGLSIVPSGADLPELASIDVVLYCAADPSPAAQLFKDLLLEITLPTLVRS